MQQQLDVKRQKKHILGRFNYGVKSIWGSWSMFQVNYDKLEMHAVWYDFYWVDMCDQYLNLNYFSTFHFYAFVRKVS